MQPITGYYMLSVFFHNSKIIMEDLSKKFVDALFNELKNQAKQSIPEKDYKDFENYIEKYFENPTLELVYTKKRNSEKIYYSDIIKKFIKAYQINS